MKRQKRYFNRKLGSIERELLEELALSPGDLLYGFLLSMHSTKRMMRLAHQRATRRYRRKCAVERLIAAEFIRKRGDRLSITEAGKNVLAASVQNTRAMLRSTPWDKRWRIVIFDIPEQFASLRDRVRAILKRAGFVQVQQSVWIFPHECEELVRLIKEESDLSEYILYGVLERIEGEARFKRIFAL